MGYCLQADELKNCGGTLLNVVSTIGRIMMVLDLVNLDQKSIFIRAFEESKKRIAMHSIDCSEPDTSYGQKDLPAHECAKGFITSVAFYHTGRERTECINKPIDADGVLRGGMIQINPGVVHRDHKCCMTFRLIEWPGIIEALLKAE